MIKSNISRFLMINLCLFLATSIQAQNVNPEALKNLPQYYPSDYYGTGILHSINIQDATLIINATQYHYDSNIKVHSLNTEHSSLHALKPDMELGFNITVIAGKQLISEVWVLPKEAVILR